MKRLLYLLVVISCIGILISSMTAQTPTGTIEGNVTDPQSNVVAGATVTITEVATGRATTTTTNDQGFYTARSLQPGLYSVKIEKQGFSTATADKVVVQVGLVAKADIGLKIGSAAETVQVDIGVTDIQVDTVRQTVDGVITARQITALPLNARNFLDLAGLQPSVTVVDGGNIDPTKSNAYRAVRVNGGSGTGTRVQIEGIDVTDETVGTTTANISTDAVQEFNLSRSSFDLGTSLTTSGAISIASQYGKNKFSGSGFYFKQDDRFDARPEFESVKPEFNRDQEGYRFGGPILKDRLFFFSNFERFKQINFASFTSGDFSQFNSASSLPITTRYALNRLDWSATSRLKFLYLHNYNDDSSTGGTIRSPFTNADWTNLHVFGANLAGAKLTHSFRFGYVNFNNQINSSELSGFEFPRTPQGIAYQLNVSDLSIGPNGLAPQQTYQDNYQFKYDGSAVLGSHILRYGGEINHIILGGFANFAGPLTVIGQFPPRISNNPLDYPLQDFSTGPNAGFFTARPAHNLPFGGKFNTRYAAYVGDQWRIRHNLTLNLGVRYNYETNFFASADAPRIPQLDVYGAGLGTAPKYPKNAFSPQVGFAWDVFGDGKTSIRGGFYLAYEANIFNNSLFDEFARITTGIGPSVLGGTNGNVVGPDGSPIVINGIPGCDPAKTAKGDYTCLLGRSISSALPFLGQIHTAVQAAYSNLSNYDPLKGPSEFENSNGNTFGGQYTKEYKIPYSMQFNIGFQREIFKGHVLAVDYVRQRGVGLPIVFAEYENRRDARFFNAAEAQSRVNDFLAEGCQGKTINQAISTGCLDEDDKVFFPTIADFSLASDAVFTGRTSLTRARIIVGGFSLYQGLQVSLNGRFGTNTFNYLRIGDRSLLKGMTYTLGYALATNKGTVGSARPEFFANVTNNLDYNHDYGPNGLDRRHILGIGASMDLIGGFRLDQTYRFSTSPAISLFLPNFFGTSGIFTSDINGDGGHSGTPRPDLLPGTNIGDFGRKIHDIKGLNQVISAYNTTQANKLTPQGQRLVQAGIFTEGQLRALGAVTPAIDLIPESNPNPFQNRFSADYRLSRPIRIWKETWQLEPSISFFNVFNNAAKGTYTGLDGTCGSLNFDYASEPANDPNACNLAALDRIRTLAFGRRQLQFGIRFSF
jgi:hypothetical protein